ncbi:baseplate J/gp47 family protein [Pseudomonas sp. LM13]
MAFELDSLEQTRQLIARDIETRLPGTGAQTRRTAAGVIAFAQAGAVHGLHAHIAYRERNFLPDERADAEGVERWAGLLGLWYREPTYAAGSAELSGIAGALLAAGTVLQSTQGVLYVTLADATLAGATASVTIRAQEAGAAGNLEPGARLTLLSPTPGVQSTLSVGSAGLTGGADAESLDGLRTRVLNRLRNPPRGGSLADYKTWALDAHPAVTRAWVTEYEQGAGSVTVRLACDNEATPIPSQEVLDAVAAYIDQRRQAGRKSVYVLPPVAAEVLYRIQLKPDTAAIRLAVEAELRDLHRRTSAPGSTLLLSHIREAISTAAGELDHELLAPQSDLTHGAGVMPVFGGIEWL